MKINFGLIKQKKIKEKENTKLIEGILKDYLSDYFENVEFDYNFGRDGFTFLAKEVEFRRDLLQKVGIPLELSIGKIKFIKFSVKSLIKLKNFSVEISDIDIEVQTIHISKDYKKNYLNYRQKFLNEWESKHKKFFNSMAKPSILEEFVVNRLIPIKIEIKNINIKLNDSISAQNDIKQIELKIDAIHSLGCNEKWEIIEEQENDKLIYRTIETQNVSVLINQIRNFETFFLGSLFNEFNMNVKLTVPRTYKNSSLRIIPKFNLEIAFVTPLIINLSVPNIKILQNLLGYLMKIKIVEKYWVNRPEFKEEEKINKSDAMKWFLYAFRVLREEIRNNKRQNYELSTLIEKIISMEKYIQYYKESHKLIIAPWIHQKDHKVELQNLENKMSLDDIIYCRELAFAELLTEGRAFCASGEVGEGYKPFVHLWEFYVNDLRTKWMNKEEPEPTTIKLSDSERRQLMTIWKNDRDMVLLSYIKGEPNHPRDILLKFTLNVNLIMVNFSRNIPIIKSDETNQEQLSELNKIYANIYDKQIQSKLKYSLHFSSVANSMTNEQIEKFVNSDIKVDDNNDSDDDAVQLDLTIHSKSNNHESKGIINVSNHSNEVKEEKSCIYIDEISINAKKATENENHDTSIRHVERLLLKKQSKDKLPIVLNAKQKPNHITKTILTLIIFDSVINYINKRNDERSIKAKISSLTFIDHNFSYLDIKNNKNNLLSKIFLSNVFNEERKSNNILNNNQTHNQENLIYFFIDLLRQPVFRDTLLKKGFMKELNFLNLYEENFGFKKCEVQGQGYLSLNEHFSEIVIEYLLNKEVFEALYNKMLHILNEKYKKKYDKLSVDEKKELLKRMIVKRFSDFINPNQKPLYERSIQENYIKKMIEDLNTMFRIVCIQLIQHIVSSFYYYHINESNISRCFSMHIKTISDNDNSNNNLKCHNNYSSKNTIKHRQDYFIKAEYYAYGREYPNYIMQSEQDFVEKNYNTDKEDPDTSITVKISTDIKLKITNELLAEMALLIPELTKGDKEAYAGNILNDLTRSHLKIFDDFRQLRAKWGVLKDLKRKQSNDDNIPIEITYIQNLKKYLNELTKQNSFVLFELKHLSVKAYDKMYFIEKKKNSSFCLDLSDLIIENSNYKKVRGDSSIQLPTNYDMNTICKLLFYSKLKIESIKITIDKNESIFHTDINIYSIYSLMKNTLFIPDDIIEIHSNKLIINLYPCIIKMLKNFEHLMLYKAIYSSEEMKNERNESAFIFVNKSIFKNNLARFIRNLNTVFHKECSKRNYEDSQSGINNLEYYLENRLNKIMTYSIGYTQDENKGIILNFYREDNNCQLKSHHEFKKTKSFQNYIFKSNELFTESKSPNYLHDNMKLVQPFFSLKTDLIIYSSHERLFYHDDQIWLCPFYTRNDSKFQKLNIELMKGAPYRFSSYEYIMSPLFIAAITPRNIHHGKLDNCFPYDNRFIIQEVNLNCVYKKTTFFYEDSNELRQLYLEHFKDFINANTLTYLSTMEIILNKIHLKAFLENNEDLIESFYNVSYYQSLYHNEPLTKPLRYKRDLEALESKNNIKHSQRNKKEYNPNIRKISIHIIDLLIKKLSIKLYYRLDNPALNNLSLLITIKSINYNENNYNKKILSSNEEIIKGKLSINSILLVISIPKNFNNLNDFDSEDRVPIWERSEMKQFLIDMKSNKTTEGERIAFLIKNTSLKLTNQDQVVFQVSNTFSLGFTNQKGTIKSSNINITEDILWIFSYKNGTDKEKEKIHQQVKEIISIFNEIDKNNDKSIEIIFTQLFIREKDQKLSLFNPVVLFSNFGKMIYIIKSTIGYEMIYKAIIKTNLVTIDLPNRLYHYVYYIDNWIKVISKMIKNVNNQTNRISKVKTLKEEDSNDDLVIQDLNLPYNDETIEIFTMTFPQLFLTFKHGTVTYSRFIFLNSKGQIFLNSNNEKVFSFSSVDVNWKVLDCSCKNLILKKKPKDMIQNIFEVCFLLNEGNTLSKESKIKHKFLIHFKDIEIVYLQRYVIEVLNYFDYNEICLREFPFKSALNKLFPLEKSDIEAYYYVLNNFSIILPENSKSSNYLQFNCLAGTIQTNTLVDVIQLVILPHKEENFLVIDKDSIFGIQSTFSINDNQYVQYLSTNAENLFYFTKQTAQFVAIDSYIYLNGKKEPFLTADNISIIFQTPKSEHILTRFYQYLWKQLNKRIIRLKSKFKVFMKLGKLNLSLGNFFAVDKLFDNNFDEVSPLFAEINNVFKVMDFDFQFENEGEISVDVFKAFSNFFEHSAPIQKIGNTLPGYNKDIDYDTTM